MGGTQGRRRQRGIMVVVAAEWIIILVMLLVAGYAIARLAVQRDEHQAQADAYAVGAAQVAMRDGIDAVCNHPGLRQLVAANSQTRAVVDCPRPIERVMPDGSKVITYQSNVRGTMETGFFGEDMAWNLRTTASSSFQQIEFDEAERRYPKFVLVLDYSGSMGGEKIRALRSAVTGLLDAQLRVEYGLVMFNSDVIRTIGVDFDNRQEDIRNAIRRNEGGGTNFVSPMRAAIDLLTREENTGYYILFISDGQPNEGRQPGIDQSDRARARDITVFTLAIGGDADGATLQRMAGPPGAPGDRRYYYPARDANDLQRTFREIVASILCTVGPLRPQPAANQEVHAFLRPRGGGGEQRLPVTNDLDRDAGRLGYQYVRAENKIRLTERTCDQVIDNGAEVVARFGSPKLVQ